MATKLLYLYNEKSLNTKKNKGRYRRLKKGNRKGNNQKNKIKKIKKVWFD
jgi:hypothetical protein